MIALWSLFPCSFAASIRRPRPPNATAQAKNFMLYYLIKLPACALSHSSVRNYERSSGHPIPRPDRLVPSQGGFRGCCEKTPAPPRPGTDAEPKEKKLSGKAFHFNAFGVYLAYARFYAPLLYEAPAAHPRRAEQARL